MQNTSVRRCFCDFELLNELESQLADIHQQFKQNYLNEFENIGDSYLQIRRNKNLILSSDKLTVTHTSNSQLHSDASIQSTSPVDETTGVGYYEITVLDVKDNGVATLGLAKYNYPANKQPGWVDGSYGYHGDDGNKFHDSGDPGTAYGPIYSTGDTVGCGIVFRTRNLFFTKNGKFLGWAFKNINRNCIYPTIGLDRATVTVNFGAKKFLFDIESMEEEEQMKEKAEIESVKIDNQLVHKIVRDYLIHEGYAKTVLSMDSTVDQKSNENLEFRAEIKKLILDGNITEAVNKIAQKAPKFLSSNIKAHMLLECQNFIEAVRNDKMQMAIEIAQSKLYPFLSQQLSTPSIQDVVGLLAYQQPMQSPLRHLLDKSHRMYVADQVNSALLAHFGKSNTSSHLEQILRQLYQVYKYVRTNPVKDFLLESKPIS